MNSDKDGEWNAVFETVREHLRSTMHGWIDEHPGQMVNVGELLNSTARLLFEEYGLYEASSYVRVRQIGEEVKVEPAYALDLLMLAIRDRRKALLVESHLDNLFN